MTQPTPNHEGLLSREEMDSLLDGLVSARREDAEAAGAEGAPRDAGPHRALRRELQGVGDTYAKRLSTIYQRRIEWTLRDLGDFDAASLAELIPAAELFWVFGVRGGASGWIAWNRSLFFAWLQIAFGALEPRGLPLERAFTAIERNFLAGLGREMTDLLAPVFEATGLQLGEQACLRDVGDLLASRSSGWLLAQFEVKGFGDLGQVQVALPQEGARTLRASGEHAAGTRQGAHERAVYAAPVAVHAEVGSVEISVQSLASLRAGDVVPLRASNDGSVLLKVGGSAKFRARRGVVGERLAVQIEERIGD